MAIINKKCIAEPDDICRLAVELGISNATAAVLINRGIDSEEIGRQFLDCDDSVVNDPFLMLGMYEAVDFLTEAIEDKRKITIYGDYDVDGITSVSILYRYLKSAGADINCYIPNRFTEGYGMNIDAISKISAKGSEIIIALDCGITSLAEVALAKELGMDVMIVDHHNPPEELPDADIIINPKQKYCQYPFKELCAAGLALKLVEAHGGKAVASDYYDIAAIGTVADVVPLKNENRYYVRRGIIKMNTAPSAGVKALKVVAGYADKNINARGIAFGMAPRLNAAGRMSTARDGLNMFLSDDFKTAYSLALKLNEYNEERRKIEKEIYDSGTEMILSGNLCDKKIIIAFGEGWNKGVIGIAASRFVEKYNRPSLVISCGDDVCTGSARSIDGFDIYKALCECRDLYTKFGGHSQAAGFSLPRANIPEFVLRMEAYADKNITEDMLVPRIDCEFKLSPSDINMKTAKELASLEPFGKDNEAPVFYSDRLNFKNAVIIGKDKNVIRTALDAGGLSIDCVGFGKADYIDAVNCTAPKSAVFSVDINTWQGIEKVQLGLKEIKINVFNEQDIDAVAETAGGRLFEAFKEGFVVNEPVQNESITLEEAFENVLKHKTGSLLIVSDEASLKKILELTVKNNFQDNIDIHIGALPSGRDFGTNAVLAMPYKDTVLPGEFSRVYASDYIAAEMLAHTDRIRYYKASNPFANEKHLDRDSFAAIYKALKENAHRFSVWSTVSAARDILCDVGKMELSLFGLKLALNVFSELGFISYEEADGMIKLMFADNIKKRQLTDSALYNKYINIFTTKEKAG